MQNYLGIVIALVVAWWFLQKYFVQPQKVVVKEHERGVLYKKGVIIAVHGPGFYRLKTGGWWREEIVITDLRETSLIVSGQEILTKDNIGIKINTLVRYQIEDPKIMMLALSAPQDRLYQEVQIHLRDAVNLLTLEELMAARTEMGKKLSAPIRETIATYGLKVLAVEVKDLILPPEIRVAFVKPTQARKEAEASLVSAREKVATARALANAAEIVKKDPMILTLKKLAVLEEAASTPGTTFVVRMGDTDELDLKK